jgi:hypothetical protein
MYTSRERQYLSRILRDTSISNCEMVSPPGPKQVMESSAKAVSFFPQQLQHPEALAA